jgi:hypothetical protein
LKRPRARSGAWQYRQGGWFHVNGAALFDGNSRSSRVTSFV